MSDLATFNPFDPAAMQCPFPHYAQMRDEQPVMQIEGLGMYLVTRHDLVMQILRDPATYSSKSVLLDSRKKSDRLAYPEVLTWGLTAAGARWAATG